MLILLTLCPYILSGRVLYLFQPMRRWILDEASTPHYLSGTSPWHKGCDSIMIHYTLSGHVLCLCTRLHFHTSYTCVFVQAIEYQLNEEAFEIYKKFNRKASGGLAQS